MSTFLYIFFQNSNITEPHEVETDVLENEQFVLERYLPITDPATVRKKVFSLTSI